MIWNATLQAQSCTEPQVISAAMTVDQQAQQIWCSTLQSTRGEKAAFRKPISPFVLCQQYVQSILLVTSQGSTWDHPLGPPPQSLGLELRRPGTCLQNAASLL